MSEAVLRSVKPYWIYKIIYTKEKTIEVGKNYPKDDNWNGTVYLYCSKDMKSFNRIPKEHQEAMRKYLGKVVCKFVCDRIDTFPFSWENFTAYGIKTYRGFEKKRKETCLSIKDIDSYANSNGHTERLYGWHISKLKIYDQPKELSEFYTNCEGGNEIRCRKCIANTGKSFCETHLKKPILRPPQSWCYCEEISDD